MEQKREFSDVATTDNMINLLKEDSFYKFLSKQDEEIKCNIFVEYRAACGWYDAELVPMQEFNEYFEYEEPIMVARMAYGSENFDRDAEYFSFDKYGCLETLDFVSVCETLEENVDKDMLEEMPLLRSLMKAFYDNSGKDEKCITAFES